ncbi:hypothetical protein QOZ80_5BG0456160 [Eleusine coracana subsp. coracana]|nr:hypothetical protein QOZ80_5BG0456160 [Eleusine coracana subsp. coracana]
MAISIISGLLAYKPRTRLVWEGVCSSISIDQASLYNENGEGMRKILSLGYRDLPQHLKVCLLHLSIFPGDYPISRGRLIRSWIAEGFIIISENSSHDTVEELAEAYLDELINRGFIQPVVSGTDDNKTKACLLICGTVHKFIESKAAKENVGTVLGDENKRSVLCGTIRRLSVMNLKENYDDIPESRITSHNRSLYSFVVGSGAKLFVKHFPFLWVLDLEGFMELTNNDVEKIARRLLNLRYLSIRDTPVSRIPDQIGQLQFLTTLDLRGTKVQELPMSVVHLQRLAHLLCDTMKFPAEWIGKMATLSCLSQFDVLQCSISSVEQLGNLSELRELTLWWSPETEVDNIDERCEH